MNIAFRTLYMVLLWLLPMIACAQVSVTALNTPHSENFNTLPSSGTATWVDNSTLGNWYHWRTRSGRTFVAGDGASITGALYSFGAASNAERALGSVGSGNTTNGGDFTWGVRMKNNTGGAVTSISVSYYGEQWRNSAAAAQTVNFLYQTGTTVTSADPTSGTWVPVSTLDFTSPITGGSAGALDGNASANRVSVSGSFTVNLADGDEIMLLWSDIDHSGSDHGLAIDDVVVTFENIAIPVELSSFQARVYESEIRLKWRTETELNNYGFVVERRTRTDDRWEDIGFVNGHGTIFTPQDYSYSDIAPDGSTALFYRLRQMDRDGTTDYSPEIKVTLARQAEAAALSVYPLPSSHYSTVAFNLQHEAPVCIAVLDLAGRRVLSVATGRFDAGQHQVTFPVHSLLVGSYILVVIRGEELQRMLFHVIR